MYYTDKEIKYAKLCALTEQVKNTRFHFDFFKDQYKIGPKTFRSIVSAIVEMERLIKIKH